MNNLSKGNITFDGKFTFHKGDRTAQNDIVIVNKPGLRNLTDFVIFDDLNWNPSDHTPITIKVSVSICRNNIRNLASKDIFTTSGEPELIRRKRINVNNTDWDVYNTIISM